MKRRAFTLIELLVVIAIIAILAAILFPVFAQAKDQAKKTTAVSNVKQQGMAMLMYCGDFDDVFPLSTRINDLQNDWVMWQTSTFPYVKNDGVYYSPRADIIYQPWFNIKHYGSLPRAAVQGQANWVASNVARSQLNGIENALHDGILGYASTATSGQWYAGNAGLGQLTTASLSQTSIVRNAETAMIFDANMFDANYLTFDPNFKVGYCTIWTDGVQTWYDMILAAARWVGGETDCRNMVAANNGAPDYGGRIRVKNGQATLVYCDGHAASPQITRLYRTNLDPSNNKYLYYFMPNL